MELEDFKKLIKQKRNALIPSPRALVEAVIRKSQYSSWSAEQMIDGASEFVLGVRELCWQEFLEYEREFNVDVADPLTDSMTSLPTVATTKEIVAAFLYENSDHLFELAKSSSNSRRSRAGKEFEILVEEMFQRARVPFDSQGKIGSAVFKSAALGKLVDCVIPSVATYSHNKRDCVLVSMKTSLRERWQEVVEEMRRTGVAEMMLATLDSSVSRDTIEKLSGHNITLIVPRQLKLDYYSDEPRVYDFEWLIREAKSKLK